MKNNFSVWVLEIAVLHATQKKISRWEVWQAFNTRQEAVAERDKPQTLGGKPISKEFLRATQRIRKYVPS